MQLNQIIRNPLSFSNQIRVTQLKKKKKKTTVVHGNIKIPTSHQKK